MLCGQRGQEETGEEKNELGLARIEGRERKKGKICISDIKKSFCSVDGLTLVRYHPSRMEMDWKA